MKVAIVSDSHGSIDRLGLVLFHLEDAGVKHVIHVGDFLVYGIVEVFQNHPDIRFHISLGNCDVNEMILSELRGLSNVVAHEVVKLELEDKIIVASHIEGVAQNVYAKEKVDVYCHGHTHRSKAVKRDGIVVLNPGALCEDGKYFLLTLPELTVEQYGFDDNIKGPGNK